jgi:hypothetical protein
VELGPAANTFIDLTRSHVFLVDIQLFILGF